ncbi:hypothetical protein GALL_548810 [mine drainage metagenome]|uniref:Uncharacterized protein n=1 Tax=mine drainage metagenome TaxID=410659 RepID=A0A1J5PEB6_9ZZZZ
MINTPQQHHLDQHADRCNDQRRRNNAAPKPDCAGKSLGERERHISAEHVERAMSEIDDPRHAENDRQAGRHQKQRRRAGKSGQELDDVKGHLQVCANAAGVRRPQPIASLLRAHFQDFGIAGKIVRALAIDRIHHHALAVLQRGLADERAERRLMIDLAEDNLAER